jgi:hypothetical protein
MAALAGKVPQPAGAKVFCFFFSKKKRFLKKVVDASFRWHDV